MKLSLWDKFNVGVLFLTLAALISMIIYWPITGHLTPGEQYHKENIRIGRECVINGGQFVCSDNLGGCVCFTGKE